MYLYLLLIYRCQLSLNLAPKIFGVPANLFLNFRGGGLLFNRCQLPVPGARGPAIYHPQNRCSYINFFWRALNRFLSIFYLLLPFLPRHLLIFHSSISISFFLPTFYLPIGILDYLIFILFLSIKAFPSSALSFLFLSVYPSYHIHGYRPGNFWRQTKLSIIPYLNHSCFCTA